MRTMVQTPLVQFVVDLLYKKLYNKSITSSAECRCRGTARRATNMKNRAWRAWSGNKNDLEGHSSSSELLLFAKRYITYY